MTVSTIELAAMHDIRIDGNDGAHPVLKKHRFVRANAEIALRNARVIRDWLDREYLQSSRRKRPIVQPDLKAFNKYDAPPTRGAVVREPSQVGCLPAAFAALIISIFLLAAGPLLIDQIKYRTEPTIVSFDGKQPATLRQGELVVTVGSKSDADGSIKVVATGLYKGQSAFSIRTEQRGTTADVGVVRLDSNTSLPQIFLRSFTGGAHCCTESKFATADTLGNWHVVDGEILDGEYGYRFEDLDGDGVDELVSIDNSFLYAFECYACSYAPVRIHKLVGLKLLNMTLDPRYQKFLREALRRIEAGAGSNSRSNGYLGGWVASKILIGELNDAWRKMLSSYDRQSDWVMEECVFDFLDQKCPKNLRRKLTFPEALAKHLVKNGYITSSQAQYLPMK